MADLIAQGPEPEQRWRRVLRPDEPAIVGRDAGLWSVGWDDHVSRQHAELCWRRGILEVKVLPAATNPVFVAGKEVREFALSPGEHFVIGGTSFTLADEHVNVSLDVAHPVKEQTFSAQYLRRLKFRDPDKRIEVLSRLPEVISGAANDYELYTRLVSVLLSGIRRASTIVLVGAGPHPDSGATAETVPFHVLHWDRRLAGPAEFRPSQRLIEEALSKAQSVVHLWGAGRDASPAFTLSENVDWAFCTPVQGVSGWAIYVAGRFTAEAGESSAPSDPTDLREDVKFTELVAAILSALRQLHTLERRQAALGRFFSPAVLEALAAQDPEVALAPRETEVSVLFCDLRGFALETERHASDLLGHLHRVSQALGVMTHHILDQGGVFGDFQGDAAMGFWGWPLRTDNDIERACLAALAIRLEFEAAASRLHDPLADFHMGIGLAAGKAVAGRIGTTDQVKVTVFGPVVNRASRLENMTKILHTPILLDDVVAAHVKRQISPLVARCRRIALVRPYGVDTPVEVSELLPPQSQYPELLDQHIQDYEAALDAFIAGKWSAAIELLHRVPATDRVKDFLMVFIAQHNRTPPPEWSGVIPISSKA